MRIDPNIVAILRSWFPALDLDGVRVVVRGPVCWFVRNVLRQGAMTVAPFIFFGRDAYDPKEHSSVALLAHELKHVDQYRRYGYVAFFARYFWALGKNRFRYSRDLPLEAEAYALQAEVRDKLRGTNL